MRSVFLVVLILIAGAGIAVGQSNAESPVAHMTALSEYEKALSEKYMSYMSEVAHGGRARKMEKRREDVINSVRTAIREGGKLRPYQGDASLREAYKQFWTVLLNVFLEDYHKIMDMEEVAERSYDAMEAYLLIQEKASEKLDVEGEKVQTAYNAFAAKHNVRLSEGGPSKLDRKLAKTGKVNKYANEVFLIFFKSNVQEGNAYEAFKKNDINGFEQSKASLLKYAIEGLGRLDTIKPFGDDGSMVTACRKVLEFHKDEAQNKLSAYSEYIVKKEEMEKAKKSFESKPEAKRTQADVDQYNKAIDTFNKAVNSFNKTNTEVNASREKVGTHWEQTRKRFMDRHVPRS